MVSARVTVRLGSLMTCLFDNIFLVVIVVGDIPSACTMWGKHAFELMQDLLAFDGEQAYGRTAT